MVYSNYKQQRIIYHSSLGKRSTTIAKDLKEDLNASRSKYHTTGSIGRQPGPGSLMKITIQVLELVEQQMEKDDETTAIQLQKILVDNGYTLSLTTILKSRTRLGWWTFQGSAYCQIIRQENKVKRLEWARKNEH